MTHAGILQWMVVLVVFAGGQKWGQLAAVPLLARYDGVINFACDATAEAGRAR
jgi:hypothetical protein